MAALGNADRASAHYSGPQGEAYSAWQRRLSRRMGPVLARKFARYADGSQTILDFGCGDASILRALPAKHRIGVEPNAASRHVHDAGLIESHASLASVAEDSVDLAITNHALEHCRHPLADLIDIRRVLSPQGRLVLIVPIDDWRAQRRYDPDDVNHHLYTWTPRLLGNLLAEAGYAVERIAIVRHAWPPGVFYLSRLPGPIFDVLCRVWSRFAKVAELHAVCTPAAMLGPGTNVDSNAASAAS